MKATLIDERNQTEKQTITNIEELIETIKILNTTIYQGYDTLQPYAWIWGASNQISRIKIEYNDLWDCKKTELQLQPYLTKFARRKLSFDTRDKSITLSVDCKEELNKLKKENYSYEMVIWQLLMEHYGMI